MLFYPYLERWLHNTALTPGIWSTHTGSERASGSQGNPRKTQTRRKEEEEEVEASTTVSSSTSSSPTTPPTRARWKVLLMKSPQWKPPNLQSRLKSKRRKPRNRRLKNKTWQYCETQSTFFKLKEWKSFEEKRENVSLQSFLWCRMASRWQANVPDKGHLQEHTGAENRKVWKLYL